MVTVWRMRTELGMEIARRIYLYLVQKYPQGFFFFSFLSVESMSSYPFNVPGKDSLI